MLRRTCFALATPTVWVLPLPLVSVVLSQALHRHEGNYTQSLLLSMGGLGLDGACILRPRRRSGGQAPSHQKRL